MKREEPDLPSKLRVAVVFDPDRKPKPAWFDVSGQRVQVVSINYYWESHIGSAKIMNYTVSTDTMGLCELQFDTKEQKWTMRQLN